MDAVSPTPIKIKDLTRDELLQLVSRFSFGVRQRDLWWARYEVACRRSEAASAASIAASNRAADAAVAWARVPRTRKRALEQAGKAYRKIQEEAASIHRAADRAYAAQERAYRAFDACKL